MNNSVRLFAVGVFLFATSLQGEESTLEQLKAAGATQSKYRSTVSRPVSSDVPKANLQAFRAEIEPTLKKACYKCHGSETAEGDFRVDTLDPDLLHGDDVSWWLEVSAAVTNGEMPPEDGPSLTDEDREEIVEWLSTEIQNASQVQRAEQGYSSFRRMTRYEYNYALQDLLGLNIDFAKDLPPDPISPEGFENNSEILQITGRQYAEYLELNRNALNRATISGQRPEVLHWSVSAQQAYAKEANADQENKKKGRQRSKPAFYKNQETGETAPATWSYLGAVHAWAPTLTDPEVPQPSEFITVPPPRQRVVVELGNRLPDKGTMRVRVRASRASAEHDDAPSLALEFGWQGDKDPKAAMRISRSDQVIDELPGEPKFYQWDIPLSEIHPRNPVRKRGELGTTLAITTLTSFYLAHRLTEAGCSQNSISLDQFYAARVEDQTRFSSLVISTDGGTGPNRKAHTMSFNVEGHPIPAENKPKRIFDMLLVKKNDNAARRIALSQSVLDHLMEDASSLRRQLSKQVQQTFEEFLGSVRDTEIKVTKSARWINLPLPTVDVDHLNLDNTLLLFGSASSAFHLSRNDPLILAGGKSMGFKHGQYLNFAEAEAYRGGWAPGDKEPWRMRSDHEDLPLANLYATMLQRLGVETDTFADSTGTIAEV